ncbi:MAG TPA: histidine phosphatase family protein [Acidimicrobiales bacterium]|jgi:broad specificity phosphatase PhoE|nr:histidine phosphatase family protein [Acidimicrobiales bacterium]
MPRADRSSTTATAAGARRGERRAGRRSRPTTVLLVRHGATTTTGRELPGRAPGLHLSDEGRRQAEQVAERIAAFAGLRPPDGDGAADRAGGDGRWIPRRRSKGPTPPRVAAVYASPLERTRETAEPIARLLGLEVVPDEGLIELDVGEWTGMELKAARKRKEWATIQRYPSGFTFPGGESFLEMQARITGTLERLRAAHPGEVVVAVSHADPIRAAVAHAMGTHLDLFQRVVVSPCSITAIAYGDEGPTVLTVNETGATGAVVPS